MFTKHRFRAGGGGRVPRRLSLQLSAGAAAAHHAAGAHGPRGGGLVRFLSRTGSGDARPGALLAAPAVFINAVGGQNGTWTAALFGGGLSLLERRPLLAGGLLGLLIYKPQLALLIPVALLAGRHWRAFAAAADEFREPPRGCRIKASGHQRERGSPRRKICVSLKSARRLLRFA